MGRYIVCGLATSITIINKQNEENDIFEYLRNCIVESSSNPIRSATMLTMIG